MTSNQLRKALAEKLENPLTMRLTVSAFKLRRILTAMEGMEQALWMIKRMSDVDNGNGFNRVAREALAALDLDDDAKEPAK